MKLKFNGCIFAVIIAANLAVSGCHVLPSIPTPASTAFGSKSVSGLELSGTPISRPVPSKAGAGAGMQQAANNVAHLAWVFGLIALALAGLFGYGQQVIPSLKCGGAGVILIFGGTWFAWHWQQVLAVALCASAVGFVWAERRSAPVKSLLSAANAEIDRLKQLPAVVRATKTVEAI